MHVGQDLKKTFKMEKYPYLGKTDQKANGHMKRHMTEFTILNIERYCDLSVFKHTKIQS